jgi:hypothetical protein
MRWGLLLITCLVTAGCGVAPQPESLRTVAAFEVPLPSDADRAEFLSLLGSVANAEGMEVHAESREELEHNERVNPLLKQTIHAAVWRDDQPEVSISDSHDHLGQVWIMFARGKDPALAGRYRERVMQDIRIRWPETLSLPIMPTGAIPLPDDLVRTPTGYVVNPAAAPMYGLQDNR